MAEEMTSRERVLTALNHEQPDRVPIDFGGNQSSIHVKAYEKLRSFLNLDEEDIKFSEIGQHIAAISEDVLQRFHADVRYVRPDAAYIDAKHPDLQVKGSFIGYYDQFGVFWGNDASKDLDDILYLDPVIHPLASVNSVQDIDAYPWPDGSDTSKMQGVEEVARHLHEDTSYAVSTGTIGNLFEYCTFLFGFVQTLKLVRKNPEIILRTSKHLLDYYKAYNTTFLGKVGQYLDIICINGDLAGQDGPIFNPAFYEQHIMPLDKELVEHVKNLADVKINYHCCGSTPLFIPHWITAGFDIFNPVQVSAHDMDPCSLKARFGNEISFWGGLCDTQGVLPFGTTDQVREEVKKNMNCLKPGGGYVAGNIHNITAEVPPENIVAMFDAALEFGTY